MGIKTWTLTERPREKLLLRGSASLSNAELLAVFLRTGVRGKTAVDLARDLLQQFGSLRNLLHCSLDEFIRMPGLGEVKYVQLQALIELSSRYLQEKIHKAQVLSNHDHTIEFLTAKLRHLKHEVFACLFLDAHNHLIAYEELSKGTFNQSRIYPREIVKAALRHNAAAIIFAHNHPSGICEPSREDLTVTEILQQALAFIEVKVHDHLIIGDGQTLSFAQRGWLQNMLEK